jgi:hypothetical protein
LVVIVGSPDDPYRLTTQHARNVPRAGYHDNRVVGKFPGVRRETPLGLRPRTPRSRARRLELYPFFAMPVEIAGYEPIVQILTIV